MNRKTRSLVIRGETTPTFLIHCFFRSLAFLLPAAASVSFRDGGLAKDGAMRCCDEFVSRLVTAVS